jgi:hypothetical protein
VLLAIIQTKTLLSIEYLFGTTAFSKIGNHRVIHSEGLGIVYNVWTFMSEEALNGITIPLKRVRARVLTADGIQIRRLAKPRKHLEEGTITQK